MNERSIDATDSESSSDLSDMSSTKKIIHNDALFQLLPVKTENSSSVLPPEMSIQQSPLTSSPLNRDHIDFIPPAITEYETLVDYDVSVNLECWFDQCLSENNGGTINEDGVLIKLIRKYCRMPLIIRGKIVSFLRFIIQLFGTFYELLRLHCLWLFHCIQQSSLPPLNNSSTISNGIVHIPPHIDSEVRSPSKCSRIKFDVNNSSNQLVQVKSKTNDDNCPTSIKEVDSCYLDNLEVDSMSGNASDSSTSHLKFDEDIITFYQSIRSSLKSSRDSSPVPSVDSGPGPTRSVVFSEPTVSQFYVSPFTISSRKRTRRPRRRSHTLIRPPQPLVPVPVPPPNPPTWEQSPISTSGSILLVPSSSSSSAVKLLHLKLT